LYAVDWAGSRKSAKRSLGSKLGDVFRSTVFDLPREPSFPGPANPYKSLCGEDLAELFPIRILELLRCRGFLARRGSELDLSKGVDPGDLVSLLLMPG